MHVAGRLDTARLKTLPLHRGVPRSTAEYRGAKAFMACLGRRASTPSRRAHPFTPMLFGCWNPHSLAGCVWSCNKRTAGASEGSGDEPGSRGSKGARFSCGELFGSGWGCRGASPTSAYPPQCSGSRLADGQVSSWLSSSASENTRVELTAYPSMQHCFFFLSCIGFLFLQGMVFSSLHGFAC